ncbi:hypothetical protein lacNasYZ03_09520 [Lactobacillus nasalidis]|uniref:YihY/virulence factor BrkB family protein n=1 Tax=Lactobacillus nasalidis TaxID=2797258 RepID=A0ABQ3W449_9LACO|nr:YihY/virulence factor BrkB family protein [Lactobacillus nasalidis]GHV97633.1 hypothetical protein lacNasYZ01_08150 [Lactobacillus nasalidis]GHV99504.1 hypothetical protein lacNasYZ02_09340 [Lactobacillus nasalidis]GHW01265.1 hypothetical protein lacNasYZ03_09520 [Lactobacillus nasalidis]
MTEKIEPGQKGSGRFLQTLSSVVSQGEIFQSSIVIAYYILFSIFPIIIIIGNLLPLFRLKTGPIVEYLRMILPSDIASYIIPIVETLLKSNSTGYISFGVIVALWSMSCMVNAVRIGMNRLYGVHNTELKLGFWHFIWNRTLTIIFSALMVTMFIFLALVAVFGQEVLHFLAPIFNLSLTWIDKLFSYRWLVLLVLMLIGVFYLNAVVPNVRSKKVLLPGTITTVIGWEALSYLFSFYLKNFPVKWENYGIVGTFIIFMLWLNLLAILLLFGTAVNVSLDRLRQGPAVYSNGPLAEFIAKRRKA